MTPDGISTEDWDRVQEAVIDVVNASAIEDDILCDHHTGRLCDILDELELRYGRIPGILATRADFTDAPAPAIALHKEALAVSKDPVSTRLSLQSLIRILIDENEDESSISTYLKKLERVTGLGSNSSDLDELRELRRDFGKTKAEQEIAADVSPPP